MASAGKIIPGIDDDWVCGFAMGLAEAKRLNHDHQAVRHSMRTNRVTFADMKRAGVVDYDLRELRSVSRLVNELAEHGWKKP